MPDDIQPYAVQPMTPLTTVRVLSGVPLDNTYTDTMTFPGINSQSSFFQGKTKATYTNLGPVRMQNKIRVPVNADYLYNCNYIMFQNANFGSKWFYAFITGLDFVNVNMTEISFELDVMQTWYFDYNLKMCFVEREHVANDTIGANLVPENLETGEYVENGLSGMAFTHMKLITVVATTFDETGSWTPGEMYTSVYSGLKYYGYDTSTTDGLNSLNNFLKSINDAGKTDGVVSIFMQPYEFFGNRVFAKEIQIEKPYSSVNGYVPKNKKLFTYPYIFLRVTNGQGNAANYCYEYFTSAGGNVHLEYMGNTSPNPTVIMYPLSYKGNFKNYEEGITLNGFPQCAYTTDAFKAYLAQNSSSLAVSSISSATALVSGAVTLNPAMIMGGFMGITATLSQVYQHAILPPQSQGNQMSDLRPELGIMDFFCTQMSIRAEFAKIIDDYFSMYGYAVHTVKLPDRLNRPSWNYVKTGDCKLTGNIPFSDLGKIKSIYDNGITFWHGDYVGDYSRNNNN